MKKFYSLIVPILCAILISSTAVGCFGEKAKTFSKSGMSITLTDKFYEKEQIAYTAYYESSNAIVVCLKEDFGSISSSYTLTQYANAVIENNNLSNSQVTTHDNYVDFSFERSVSGKDFYYYARCFKTTDAFWLVQFGILSSQKDEMSSKIQSWADSITFNQGV